MKEPTFTSRRLLFCTLVVAGIALAGPAGAQTGHVLPAAGAENLSFGGATTAAPVDILGALQWNPATIGQLAEVEAILSFEGFFSNTTLESSAFGASGSVSSDTDPSPIPASGIAYRSDAGWSLGMGAIGIGGFGVDYPVNTASPISSPQPGRTGQPVGGFGAVYSSYQLLQLSPTFAYEVNDWFSFGVGPTINWSTLSVTPFPAAPPDPDTMTYLSASHTDAAYGIGFQVGLYVMTPIDLAIGFTLKSPQWFETFEWNTENDQGTGRTLEFDLDYPMILSGGLAYSGLDTFLVAVDVRWVDYANTDGFEEAGFDAFGAVTGFGWQSVVWVATGVQWAALDWLTLRAGYSYNPSVIEDEDSFFNVAAPGVIEHQLYGGASFELSEWTFTLAGRGGLENSIDGPLIGPDPGTGAFGPVPDTAVKSTLSTFSLAFSVAYSYDSPAD